MHLKLTIQVDRVLYSALAQPDVAAAADPLAANGGSTAAAASSGTAGTTTLHVSGKVTSENEHVKKGAFHTLDLEIGRDFTIIKGEGEWDSVARERIKEMTEPGRGADVGAIVCGEGESARHVFPSRTGSTSYPAAGSRSDIVRLLSGVANICIITNHTTIVRQRIDVPVPRKRKGGGTALGADRVGPDPPRITNQVL
jgi:protein pelota